VPFALGPYICSHALQPRQEEPASASPRRQPPAKQATPPAPALSLSPPVIPKPVLAYNIATDDGVHAPEAVSAIEEEASGLDDRPASEMDIDEPEPSEDAKLEAVEEPQEEEPESVSQPLDKNAMATAVKDMDPHSAPEEPVLAEPTPEPVPEAVSEPIQKPVQLHQEPPSERQPPRRISSGTKGEPCIYRWVSQSFLILEPGSQAQV
jgi:hypothetical protein